MTDKRTYMIELKSGGILHEVDLLQDDLEGIIEGTHVIVPKEPTDEMIVRAAKVMDGLATSCGGVVICGQPKDIYKAMIKDNK